MSLLLLLIPAAAAALLDLTLFANIRLLGAHPLLSVALVSVWAVLRRREEAMVLAPAAGLLLGLFGNEPLGASVLGLAPLVLMAAMRDPSTPDGRLSMCVWVAFAGAALYVALVTIVDSIVNRTAPGLAPTVRQMGAAAVLTAVLSAVLYLPLIRTAWQPRVPGHFRRY
ncbi:MAG: hypothetical protein HYX51_09985 [Chloroflexi bacterium]|nr:hypothetical protein [Chloroflexota bacterium]